MSQEMQETLRKAVLFAAGAALTTADTARRFFDEMVERGAMSRPEAEKLADDLSERVRKAREDIKQTVNEAVRKTLEETGIPTREDMAALKERVRALEESSTSTAK
ncbi:phasin family protein [candidate division WOR-3 bacterium]|nr:phasin family protein [candidate division WOR-3 bacterium]